MYTLELPDARGTKSYAMYSLSGSTLTFPILSLADSPALPAFLFRSSAVEPAASFASYAANSMRALRLYRIET